MDCTRHILILSYFVILLLIGKLLQSYSKSKTADAISELSKLKQTEATLIEDDKDTRVDIQLLEIGDQIRIGTGVSTGRLCLSGRKH